MEEMNAFVLLLFADFQTQTANRLDTLLPHIIATHSSLLSQNKTEIFNVACTQILSRTVLALVALTLAVLSSAPSPALAAAAAPAKTTTEHLHTGQKVANFFRRFGIPDLGVLAIISALPVVELRGAVPVGIWMGYPIATVLPVCVVGNMIPIVPLLYVLRNPTLKKFMSPVLKRAESKTSELGIGSAEKRWASLAAFVGIPLPGTGAWTGAMGAFLLGMPLAQALSSIFAGVVSAGVIMSAITLAGKKGGIAALAVLFLATGMEFLKGGRSEKVETKEGGSEPEVAP